MTSRLIVRARVRVSRCPDRLVLCRADGIGARGGSGRRDRGAAGVGQEALSQELFAVPRREGGRRRICRPASAPEAAQLHDGQVQGSDDSQRSAPDASGPRQHHQARHAVHVDARLAHTSPTRKCRISPTSSRPSPPTSRTPKKSPSPSRSRARRRATKESVELGKKLYEETGCVKCHGTLGRGDGPSAPTLKDDWGHPIRPADLAQSWTFRGGSSREDIFRTMSTGLNGTPMPSFLDALKPEQRWAITDFIASLSGSNGPGYTNLVVAKHVQDPIDLAKGTASFASARVARFPIIGQIMEPGRSFHPPATSRDRSGDLRCGLHRPPRSMARHERGEDGEERAVASRAAGGGRGAGDRRSRGRAAPAARRGASSATRKSPRPRPGKRQPVPSSCERPLCRRGHGASRPAIRVLGRRLDPDSLAGADRRPQALLHLRRRPELGRSLVLRSGPPRSPSVHRQGKRGHRAQRLRAMSLGSRATTRANGRSSSSGRFAPRRAPRLRPDNSCPSRSRSGTGSRVSAATGEGCRCGTPSTSEPENVPSVVGPMIQTALFILAIELAVIGWVRWRSRADGLGGKQRQQPAPERLSCRSSGGFDVQEHLRPCR